MRAALTARSGWARAGAPGPCSAPCSSSATSPTRCTPRSVPRWVAAVSTSSSSSARPPRHWPRERAPRARHRAAPGPASEVRTDTTTHGAARRGARGRATSCCSSQAVTAVNSVVGDRLAGAGEEADVKAVLDPRPSCRSSSRCSAPDVHPITVAARATASSTATTRPTSHHTSAGRPPWAAPSSSAARWPPYHGRAPGQGRGRRSAACFVFFLITGRTWRWSASSTISIKSASSAAWACGQARSWPGRLRVAVIFAILACSSPNRSFRTPATAARSRCASPPSRPAFMRPGGVFFVHRRTSSSRPRPTA